MTDQPIKLLYFAWVRDRIGLAEESVATPNSVTDVASLMIWLKSRGPRYETALKNDKVVRVAINQRFAKPEDPIAPGDEIAVFPPVTGG
jgi:molybdopterin synthase sulfur carrier subunit